MNRPTLSDNFWQIRTFYNLHQDLLNTNGNYGRRFACWYILYCESLARCQNWKAESSLLYKYRCVSVQIKSVWLLIFRWISELLNWTGGGRAVCHRAAANYERDVRSEAELSLISAQCSAPLWCGQARVMQPVLATEHLEPGSLIFTETPIIQINCSPGNLIMHQINHNFICLFCINIVSSTLR